MKTKKDLAKYVVDYIRHEIENNPGCEDNQEPEDILEQALEAFESTEEIVILPEKQQMIIRLWSGLVDLKLLAPWNTRVILHDYDLGNGYEPDNPDRTYGEDSLGIYEETEL